MRAERAGLLDPVDIERALERLPIDILVAKPADEQHGTWLQDLRNLDRVPQSSVEEDRAESVAKVKIGNVRIERRRAFGDGWLTWTPLHAPGLDVFSRNVHSPDRERVPWIDAMAFLVLARFCEPHSESHIAEDKCAKMAFPDMLGARPDLVHSVRLDRELDRLLRDKDELQRHPKGKARDALSLEVRPDAERRDLDLLRGPSEQQREVVARLQPRSALQREAHVHRSGGDERGLSRRRSSRRWSDVATKERAGWHLAVKELSDRVREARQFHLRGSTP